MRDMAAVDPHTVTAEAPASFPGDYHPSDGMVPAEPADDRGDAPTPA